MVSSFNMLHGLFERKRTIISTWPKQTAGLRITEPRWWVNSKFCVNTELWAQIEQNNFKAGAAQAAAALSIQYQRFEGTSRLSLLVKLCGVALIAFAYFHLIHTASPLLLTYLRKGIVHVSAREVTNFVTSHFCVSIIPIAFRQIVAHRHISVSAQ